MKENFKGNNASRFLCNVSLGIIAGNNLIICRDKPGQLLK